SVMTGFPLRLPRAANTRAKQRARERPAPRSGLLAINRMLRRIKPAPRTAQARQPHAASKPAAKRLERGSNARFVEEVLRALAPQAVRPGDIRAALQRDKGVSLAYTSIRHALGQLEGRKAVEQDGNGGWRRRQLPDD